MRKIVWVCLMLLGLLFSTCATPVIWRHANYSESQFQKDSDQCQYEARRLAIPPPTTMPPVIPPGMGTESYNWQRADELFERCMKEKGYYKERAK
jgi:hypothetical protein